MAVAAVFAAAAAGASGQDTGGVIEVKNGDLHINLEEVQGKVVRLSYSLIPHLDLMFTEAVLCRNRYTTTPNHCAKPTHL